jgi:hypothetical protein
MQIINVCPLPREHGLHTFKRAYPCPSSMIEARDVKLSYLTIIQYKIPS